MKDQNLVIIEGVISSKFYVQSEINDKGISAVNFTIFNSPNENRKFRYAVVAWRPDPEKFIEAFKENDFVRITGHLQATPTPIENGKMAFLAKICADKVELIQ